MLGEQSRAWWAENAEKGGVDAVNFAKGDGLCYGWVN